MSEDSADRPSESDTENESVLKEAKRRFKLCQDWESTPRDRFIEDVKFANGDADNKWQWTNDIYSARQNSDEPCLTVNKIRQHNLNILNDARENLPALKIRGVGGGATYQAAQVYDGIVRRIEYISNAETAYLTAMKFQVDGGIGYIRLVTDFAGDNTFDQDIFIRRVADPLTIYLDPDAKEADKSDARYGFVFDDMERDDFDAKYPKFKDLASQDPLGNPASTDWLNDQKVRVAEYYRVVESKDTLVAMTDPRTGVKSVVKRSDVPKDILDLVMDDPATRTREIISPKVERYLIIGEQIAEKGEWAGKYIPIIPVIGEEIIVEGKMDRWGHTRAAKDPQRIYNYWSSAAVQQVALQGKQPYIGAMEAFEGYETYWENANKQNFAWLPYNGLDDKGNAIPPPARQQPPVMAQAYIDGMRVASDELQAVSGQFNADLGMEGNERSGVAITNRQRVGDLATSHYLGNLRIAIRYLGKQIIDLIPKIYDTQRIIKILAEDGTEQEVTIDPTHSAAYFEDRKQEADTVKSIFNPNVGQYEVEAESGPGYSTKRQESFDAMTQIATQSPEAMSVIGDLLFQSADWPMADKIAERYRNWIRASNPQVMGDGLPPIVVQAQKQVQNLTGQMAKLLEENAALKLKLRGKDEMRDIDVYYAETDRMKVLQNAMPTDPQGLQQLVHQLVQQSLAVSLGPIVGANRTAIQEQAFPVPPMPPMPQQPQMPAQ